VAQSQHCEEHVHLCERRCSDELVGRGVEQRNGTSLVLRGRAVGGELAGRPGRATRGGRRLGGGGAGQAAVVGGDEEDERLAQRPDKRKSMQLL